MTSILGLIYFIIMFYAIQFHNWNTERAEPFLYWRHNGKYYIHDVEERQKFVQFLANGLPWRTLYSVYSRFKILYRKKITYAR